MSNPIHNHYTLHELLSDVPDAEQPSKYVVEKGIPLPPIKTGNLKRRPPKYPLESMDVGDSVLIDKSIKQLGGVVRYYSQKSKFKKQFSCRSESPNQTRVWRIR